MEHFFPVLLDEFIFTDFLENVRRKFHFGVEQTAEIRKVAEEMLPIMREEAFWVRESYFMKNRRQVQNSETVCEKVAMSLGNGVDLLQKSYSEKGLLSESYIVEVLAGELLMRGYGAYNKYIAQHTDKHVARYHFPGSEADFPLEMLPELLKSLTQNITCNAAFCMQPKKSVVFVSELTQDKKIQCQGICAGCGNVSCTNRLKENESIRKRMTDLPLTYGYSRILGRNTL